MFWRGLSYSNVVATVALFVALGGASYAAIQLPKESVGRKQLKSGAVTRPKIKDGAVGGAQIDEATLGNVPNATHSSQADEASRALLAWKASLAGTASLAEDAIRLGGSPARAYGSVLSAHTKIPATNENTEWWLPVSGLGEPRESRREVSMIATFEPAVVSDLADLSWGAPGQGAAAKVKLVPWYDGVQTERSIPVNDGGAFSGPGAEFEIEGGARIAMQLVEEPHGEEIPAFEITTGMLISPAAPHNEVNVP